MQGLHSSTNRDKTPGTQNLGAYSFYAFERYKPQMTAAITTLQTNQKATTFTSTDAVSALAALGNTMRLQAFRHIQDAGEHGLNVGALQNLLGTPASTLNHHLNTLVRAGVIKQRREGREIYNVANLDHLGLVIDFLSALKMPPHETTSPANTQLASNVA